MTTHRCMTCGGVAIEEVPDAPVQGKPVENVVPAPAALVRPSRGTSAGPGAGPGGGGGHAGTPLEYHMLPRAGAVPEAVPLPCELHLVHIRDARDEQHNLCVTEFAGDGGDLRVIVRELHPKDMTTTNWVARVTPDWRVEDARPASVPRVEDVRLFPYNSCCEESLWGLGVVHDGRTPPGSIRQVIFEWLDNGTQVCSYREIPSARHEKNWMPVTGEVGPRRRFVYSVDPLVVLEYEAGQMRPSPAAIPAQTGYVRGGSPLIPWGAGGGFLAVVHQVYRPKHEPKGGSNPLVGMGFWPTPVPDPVAGLASTVYLQQFAKFDADLTRVELSRPFYVTRFGIEVVHGLTRWAAGGCSKEDGKVVMSVGMAELGCWLAVVEDEVVEGMFGGEGGDEGEGEEVES